MEKLMKNKLVWIGAAVIVVLGVIGGGAYYVLQGNNSTPSPFQNTPDQNVKKISAADIGLTLTPINSGKQVKLQVSKLQNITSIEYDVSYDANVTEEGQTAVVTRGVSGDPLVAKSGDSTISRVLDLGTCSKNVCKYDDVVGQVTFAIRVNYKDGTVGGVTEKVSVK